MIPDLSAQDSTSFFRFDFSARYRFEAWGGYNMQNYGDDSPGAIGDLNDRVLLQRIIPGVIYSGEKTGFSFHIQDSRAFGWSLREKKYPDLYSVSDGEPGSPSYTMNPQEEFLDIYDMNIEFRNLLRFFTVTVGRQKISFSDSRIFEPSMWGNTGRWNWDAVKVSYRRDDYYIDVFGGGTKVHDPGRISIPFIGTEFWGGGMYSHFPVNSWMTIEPFYALKTQGTADYIRDRSILRNWAGLKIYSPAESDFIYDLVYTHEFGREDGKRIDAFGLVAKTGYMISSLPSRPMFAVSYSYASGGGTENTINTFDPVYGAKSKFFGWMNIIGWSNISKPEFLFELMPAGDKTWIELKYNFLFIPAPEDCSIMSTMNLKEGKHHLGNEADILIRYQPSKRWQFIGILGYFDPGDITDINSHKPENAYYMALQAMFSLN